MSELTIIFVEDDPTQVETFQEAMDMYCAAKQRISPRIATYTSESAFLEALKETQSIADLYIFDLMLRWKGIDDTPTIAKPADYHADLAGIRCKDAVLRRFPRAQIIIWTMIEIDHIDKELFKGSRLMRMADKLEIAPLFQYLRNR